MRLKRLFGWEDDKPEDEGEGPIVIHVELDTAQLRFPQYLSELAALHRNALD